MAMADAAASHTDVLDAVIILQRTGERSQAAQSCQVPPSQPHLHPAPWPRLLTRRVTVGSRSALAMRCPSSVLVRRKRRRMLVALVKSRSRGE